MFARWEILRKDRGCVIAFRGDARHGRRAKDRKGSPGKGRQAKIGRGVTGQNKRHVSSQPDRQILLLHRTHSRGPES